MSTITDSEIQDFRNVLQRDNFQVDDFKVSDEDLTDWDVGSIAVIRGNVNIRRISNGKYKVYSSGSGSTWVSDFENDLHSGFFN